jgi:hypothetical protein
MSSDLQDFEDQDSKNSAIGALITDNQDNQTNLYRDKYYKERYYYPDKSFVSSTVKNTADKSCPFSILLFKDLPVKNGL